MKEEVGSVIGERFKILRPLGRNGKAKANTFEAEDVSTGARVCLKRYPMSHNRRERDIAERDVRLLTAVKHPAIPEYFGHSVTVGDVGPELWLAQRLVEGESLADKVASGWRATDNDARALAAEVLEVLRYLQSLEPPLFHGSIKPENLIREVDGKLFVTGFAIARALAQLGTDTSGAAFDPEGYAAPELRRGVALPSTDVYGLGGTILFALNGRPPAKQTRRSSGGPDEVPKDLPIHVRGAVEGNSTMIGWLEDATAPQATQRFASAREALLALRSGRRRRGGMAAWKLAVIGVGALSLAAGGVILARRWKRKGHVTGRDAHGVILPPRPPYFVPALLASTPVFSIAAADASSHLVAASADGALLATGGATGSDGGARIWKLADRTSVSLPGVGKHVGAVVFAGDQLVVGSDGSLRFFTTAGAPLRAIDGAHDVVTALAISGDGKTLASGGNDGIAKVWDVGAGTLRTTVHASSATGALHAVALDAAGTTLVAAGDDGVVRTWNATNGTKLQELYGHEAAVRAAAFMVSLPGFVTASDDRTVRRWTPGGEFAGAFLGPRDAVTSLAMARDGRWMAAGGKDETITIWDAQTAVPRAHLPAPSGATSLALVDATSLVVAHADGHLTAWPLPRLRRADVPRPPEGNAQPAPTAEDAVLVDRAERNIDRAMGPGAILDEADGFLVAALKANPRNARAYVARAELALRRDGKDPLGEAHTPESIAAARTELDHALAIDKGLVEAWAARGWLDVYEKNFASAATDLAEAEKRNAKSPSAASLRARLAIEKSDWDEVERCARVIHDGKDASLRPRAYDLLRDVYVARGELEAADEAQRIAIALRPATAWRKERYAAFLLAQGDFEGAIEAAEGARALADTPSTRTILLAAETAFGNTSLWDLRHFDGAQRSFEDALKLDPNSADAHYGLAAALHAEALEDHDKKMFEASGAELDATLKLAPDHALAKAARAAHEDLATAFDD